MQEKSETSEKQIKNRNQNILTVEQDGVKKTYRVIDKYMYCDSDVIGKGAFGEVFRGYYLPVDDELNDKPVAIKIQEVPKMIKNLSFEDKQNVDAVLGDIIALKLLKHSNIVRLLDVKRKQQKIYMIMEYCNQKDLEYFMQKRQVSELEIRFYFAQILEAFKYIHKKQLMHRDIKPKNIFVNNQIIKIGDFGLAKKFTTEQRHSEFKGTLLYMAPEVINGEYSPKCDIYSLGCTLYWMIYKKVIYDDRLTQIQLLQRMKENRFEDWPAEPKISRELKEIIVRMLKYEEDQRIGWQELFQTPIFNIQLLSAELNNFTAIELMELEKPQEEEDDELEWIDLELLLKKQLNLLDPKEYDNEVLKKLEKRASKQIRNVDEKIRREQIINEVLVVIDFEKGKSLFLRTIYKRFSHYLSGISQSQLLINCDRNLLSSLIIKAKFGMIKMEAIQHQRLSQLIAQKQKEQIYDIQPEDWDLFQKDENELGKLKKSLENQLFALRNLYYEPSWQEVLKIPQSIIQKIHLNMLDTEENQKESGERLRTIESNREKFISQESQVSQGFLVYLMEIVIHIIDILSSVILVILDLKNKSSSQIMEILGSVNLDRQNQSSKFKLIKDSIFLVDDLFIFLNMDKIFVWDKQQPINFNFFLEQRKKEYYDENQFNTILNRVIYGLYTYFPKQYD